jgi:PAS domain S-box-containing protein
MAESPGITSRTPFDEVELDSGAVSIATGAVSKLADLLPGDRVLVLAICDSAGKPTDLVLRDREGHLAVLAGVPEDQRPDLADLLSLAGGVMSNQALTKRVHAQAERATQAPAAPTESEGQLAPTTPSLQPTQSATEPRSSPAAERFGDDLYRTIVDESPLPLVLLDRQGAVVYVSPSMPYDLGWSKAELVGHRLIDFLHQDDRDRVSHVMSGTAAGQPLGTTMILRWRRRQSGYVTVEAAIRHVLGEVGEVEGIVMALRTNPLQWNGLGEVLLAGDRQRALADGADSGVAIISGDEHTLGAVLEANAPLGRIVGITRGQLTGLPLTSLIAEQDRNRVREALRSVAAEGDTTILEATVVPRIGHKRLATITVKSSLSADQPGRELVVCMQDTTEHAGLVAELSRTVDRLERSNEELAGLARITAHDLAAPLRAVSGLIDLLPHADVDTDTRMTFGAIRSAIDRMQGMVEGITGYAEARSQEPTRAPVNLNELVARVREMLESEIEERGARFTAEELPSVFGDEHQLERVFLNLISNALKYAGEGPPQINVYARRVTDAWRISVADRGIGVHDDEREHIFELFARGQVGSGSGIGLATCRRIVELHGGRIWVEPNPPSGSVFTFTIPDEPTVAGA